MRRNVKGSIKVTPDQNSINAIIAGLSQKVQRSPLVMRSIGLYLQQQTRMNIVKQKTPEGKPWKPLHPTTVLNKKDPRVMGSMRERVRMTFSQTSTSTSIRVYVDHPWAALHQVGAKTRPHAIFPRVKKALYWRGAPHPYKMVHHPGSVIPARPFMPENDQLPPRYQRAINELVKRMVTSL